MQANKVEEQRLGNTAIHSFKACRRKSFKEKPIINPLQIHATYNQHRTKQNISPSKRNNSELNQSISRHTPSKSSLMEQCTLYGKKKRTYNTILRRITFLSRCSIASFSSENKATNSGAEVWDKNIINQACRTKSY